MVTPSVEPSRIIGDFATRFPDDCWASHRIAGPAGSSCKISSMASKVRESHWFVKQ